MFLPRKFSRLTLRVTDVRVERVQEISDADAIAEGVDPQSAAYFVYHGHEPTEEAWSAAYAELWNSINGNRPGCAWADNPWVWVVSFERVKV